MNNSAFGELLLVLLLALFALLLIFGWAVYIVRLGRPVDVKLRGFGLQFQLTSNPQGNIDEHIQQVDQ